MSKLMGIISKIYKRYFKVFRNPIELRKIRKMNNPILNMFIDAFTNTVNNNLSKKAEIWAKKIENLREEMENDNSIIQVKDYGAGSGNIKENLEIDSDCLIFEETVSKACKPSTDYRSAIFLFELIKEFKPNTCLELGTCVGISASYIGAALSANNKGTLITIEGAPAVAKIAQNNFQRLNLNRIQGKVGRFQEVLPKLLSETDPIDFVFIDGHHDEKATLNYYEQIYPYLSEKAILIFDDISWSKGMRNAWEKIVRDERIKISIDLWSWGIGIITNSIQKKKNFTLLLR